VSPPDRPSRLVLLPKAADEEKSHCTADHLLIKLGIVIDELFLKNTSKDD